VIHSDLTAGNVLVVDGTVSAVFDWGNSLVGDWLYDVAWLVFWSPWHPGLDADFVVSETRRRCAETGADVESFDERLRCCQLHISCPSSTRQSRRPESSEPAGSPNTPLDAEGMKVARRAMLAGADVITQAPLVAGRFRGLAAR